MDESYIDEGYQLMTQYITENRIKTRNRKFLRKLDKFYDNFRSNDKKLTQNEEQEFLKLERYFFTVILDEPSSAVDLAQLQLLKILSSVELSDDKE